MYWEWILLFCVIILAIYLVWAALKRSDKRTTIRSIRNIPPEYLKGLNYVLNEQQDKAIDLFIRMLEVDSDTVETHLALGYLFRRRGEVDRAIRIHQNLIARPTLSEDQRSLALLELGMDYMRSGLLDRAESLFKELVNSRRYGVQAYKELLDIYQQEKDWHEAVEVARHLQSINRDDLSHQIAQFYCELAEQSLTRGKLKDANQYIRKALNTDPDCVRASLLEAEAESRENNFRLALKSYKRIEKQDSDYLPEVIAPIMQCYREMGKLDDGRKYLQDIVNRYDGITPLLYLTRIIEETRGEKEAIKFISKELKRRPSVRGVDKLVEYVLGMADGEIRENLQTIKEMTGKLLTNSPVYRCQHCGFDAKLMHWHCPSCKQWSTIKPVYGVAGE